MNSSRIALVLAAAAAAIASPAAAKQYQVKMLNKGADGVMVFEPAYVKAAVGDTVKFIAVDKGHDVESLSGLIPAGATPFKGAFNEEVEVKLTKPGLYAYKCTPHVGLGMVGVIQAGAATNKAEVTAGAAKLPGLAKMRMAKYLGQVK